MRPESATQLRSVRTPITFVHRGSSGLVRYAATYHLYGLSAPHAAAWLRVRAPAREHSFASSSSDTSSLGNVGVPVLPAIQSISRHVRGSKTCSHASRAVPPRWLYDNALRMSSAASCGMRFGSAATAFQRRSADWSLAP